MEGDLIWIWNPTKYILAETEYIEEVQCGESNPILIFLLCQEVSNRVKVYQYNILSYNYHNKNIPQPAKCYRMCHLCILWTI